MYGRTLLSAHAVQPTRVSADGSPKYKFGGVTLDLTTLAAAIGSDVTLPDGSVIKTGAQYLRYGQILCRITGAANTLTVTGTPTGGTFTLTVTTPYGGSATTGTIAYNAAAATVQTALQALANVGSGNATVSGSAGGPYTVTFASVLGTTTVALGTNSLTGGTAPSVTVGASLASGSTVGKFGPYDPDATDGRQTLTRGECFVLDETWIRNPAGFLSADQDQIGGVFEGGDVWIDRVLHSGAATHTLSLGPTLAEFRTAFPRVSEVKN